MHVLGGCVPVYYMRGVHVHACGCWCCACMLYLFHLNRSSYYVAKLRRNVNTLQQCYLIWMLVCSNCFSMLSKGNRMNWIGFAMFVMQ